MWLYGCENFLRVTKKVARQIPLIGRANSSARKKGFPQGEEKSVAPKASERARRQPKALLWRAT
jgi:hypothetical protein